MLGQHIVGCLKALVHIVPAVIARSVKGIAQVQQMCIIETVSQICPSDGERPFVVAQGTGTTCNLVTRTLDKVAVPVIFAIDSIDSLCMIPGMRQRQTRTEVLQQEIALLIVGTETPGFTATLCLTNHLGFSFVSKYLESFGLKFVFSILIGSLFIYSS